MRKLKRILMDAGLGSSYQESTCPKNHSSWVDRGYKFCPHCGMAIEVKIVCGICKRRFLSQRAYFYHLDIRHKKPNACPNCGTQGKLANEFALFVTRDSRKFLSGFSPVTTARKKHMWHCLTCDLTFRWEKGKASDFFNVKGMDWA